MSQGEGFEVSKDLNHSQNAPLFTVCGFLRCELSAAAPANMSAACYCASPQ